MTPAVVAPPKVAPVPPAVVAPPKVAPVTPAPGLGAQAAPAAQQETGGDEDIQPEEEPMAVSEVIRLTSAGEQVPPALPGLAGRDPQRLLAPAAASGLVSRLNFLEMGSMGCVVALLGAFYAFGLVAFGIKSMILSGTPLLGGYLMALLFGLAVLRGPLDRLLAPMYRRLARVPPLVRIGLGVFVPLFWVLVDSRDMGYGFLHAGFTVTIATMIGHVLFSSLRAPRP